MISILILAVGLVLVVEGLVFALAPSFIEVLLQALASIPPPRRRQIGLISVAVGVFLLWVAKNGFTSS